MEIWHCVIANPSLVKESKPEPLFYFLKTRKDNQTSFPILLHQVISWREFKIIVSNKVQFQQILEFYFKLVAIFCIQCNRLYYRCSFWSWFTYISVHSRSSARTWKTLWSSLACISSTSLFTVDTVFTNRTRSAYWILSIENIVVSKELSYGVTSKTINCLAGDK